MFCEKCGAATSDDKKFCQKCGAPLHARVIAPPPVSPSTPVATPPSTPSNIGVTPQAQTTTPNPVPTIRPSSSGVPAATAPPPKKGSPLVKIIVAVLGVLALIAAAGIGSCVYIGYRIEHKVKELGKELSKENSSEDTVKAETRPMAPCESRDRTGFDDYVNAAASASIPLKPGLTLTDIWPAPDLQKKDIEILHTVKAVQSSTIEINSMRLDGKNQQYTRTLCIADMLNARELETMFGPKNPSEIPGTTMFTISKSIFADLKANRQADLMYYDAYFGKNNDYQLWGAKTWPFTRVEPDDVPYPTLVNGERKNLLTIHAKAVLGSDSMEAWVLDDANNPLILNLLRPRDGWHITYLKITFPEAKKIENELAQNGRAEIYGIYFDFDSATLRPESEPVLKEISEALKNNPSWKIKIDGHTDNVGGDAYNLRLSQKRAESVMQALVKEYGISSDRMTPEGFGASKPKAPNDTVEGRALNRRVELVRE